VCSSDLTDIGDDQADQYALVLTHDLNKRFAVHALAAMTRNDDNASYRVTDYGHGDKVGTVAGGDPSVFSVGAQLRF
jgi:predicted porin